VRKAWRALGEALQRTRGAEQESRFDESEQRERVPQSTPPQAAAQLLHYLVGLRAAGRCRRHSCREGGAMFTPLIPKKLFPFGLASPLV
jgi:hypothetical protein